MDKCEIGVFQEDGKSVSSNEYYMFPTSFELETVVKIEKSRVIQHADYTQISMEAMALDGLGFVFRVGIEFAFSNCEDVDNIVNVAEEGRILEAKGCYAVLPERDGGITLYHPLFCSLSCEADAEQLNKVFVTNVR